MFRYILLVVLISTAIYGAVEAWPLITGPSLVVISPINYASYPSGIVSVSGTVLRAALLSVNGASVLHGEDGHFAVTLTFPHGGSILTITATDRFGRTVAVTRNIFVSADASVGSPTLDVGAN